MKVARLVFQGGQLVVDRIGAIKMKSRVFIGLILTASLVTSACSAKPTPSAEPSSSPTMSASPTPSVELVPIEFFYAADTGTDLVLFSEVHQIPAADDQALIALQQLVDGTAAPFDAEYSSLWGSGSTVNSIARDGDTATVDLTLGTLNLGSSSEGRAIDQIVWTLTEIDSAIKAVKLTVDGKTVESIAGHIDATGTFARAETFEVLSPVAVTSPTQGEIVSSPVVIKGEACTFEANVVWELLQNGDVIDGGSTTAGEACPTRSEWTVNLGVLAPGSYTIRAFDLSAKDGSLVVEDTKDFTVQ